MTEVFIPECESLMQTLRGEIPGGNPATIQRAAHTLKGSADLFFAAAVHERAAEIERLAHDNDISTVAARLVALEEEVGTMLTALKDFLDVTKE